MDLLTLADSFGVNSDLAAQSDWCLSLMWGEGRSACLEQKGCTGGTRQTGLLWCWMAAVALLASLSGPPPNRYIKLYHVWPVLPPSDAPKSLFVPL